VGGIAPSSTIEYYRELIAGYRVRVTDGSYPQIVINSMNLTPMLALLHANRLTETTDLLVGELHKVADAGADVGLFASNTPHLMFDAIQRRSSIPLISIVTATGAVAEAQGIKKAALIGTRFTMQGGYYAAECARRGIDFVVPGLADQEMIHEIYMTEFIHGIYRPAAQELIRDLVKAWLHTEGFDALILGGTELPFVLTDPSAVGVPFLNTTHIHVAAALEAMLGG
jgi:aspartate racemase